MMTRFRDWHFSIWRHPHHYAASIVAKLATNAATLIWALVVLAKPNALNPNRFSFYQLMLDFAPEDVYAWTAIALSLIGILRIVMKATPHWWGGIGYFVQMIFWMYIAYTYTVLSSLPLRPATAAWLLVGALLAIYAFVANPRTYPHAGDTPTPR